jgi:hypothetical protein
MAIDFTQRAVNCTEDPRLGGLQVPPIAIEVIADHMRLLVDDVAAGANRVVCQWCHVGHTPFLDPEDNTHYHALDVGGSETVNVPCEAQALRHAYNNAVED